MRNETLEDQEAIAPSVRRHQENPFMDSFCIDLKKRRTRTAKATTVIDSATGEYYGVSEITRFVEVDAEQFVKLFSKNVGLMFELSKSGLRVLGVLIKQAQEEALGKDVITCDINNKYVREHGLSKTTFYAGIDELVKHEIIARHFKPSFYFINPAIFFNGDRARFVREYRIKQKEALENNSEDKNND